MARKAIVTRTIIGTEVDVLGLNTETCEAVTNTYILKGAYDASKALKQVKKMYDTDKIQNVKITDAREANRLYGMWEEDFIKNAFELDPKTRKPLGEEENNTSAQ